MSAISRATSVILASAVVALSLPAAADPPRHAPAHGWRAKQAGKKGHVGYAGYEWELDYGVQSGNCDRRAIGTALGGIAGAVIANRVADEENRTVATLIGAAAGALIGNRIGRTFDKADEACVGHALELGKTGQSVSWTNESTGVNYRVVPGAYRDRDGSPCREFELMAVAGSEKSSRQGLACEADRGVWQVVR
jgi:surface antigen